MGCRLRLIERQGTAYARYGVFRGKSRRPIRTLELLRRGFASFSPWVVSVGGRDTGYRSKAAALRAMRWLATEHCRPTPRRT